MGYTDVEIVLLNDVYAVKAANAEKDTMNLFVPFDGDGLYIVIFTPLSAEDYQPYIENMAYSVSLHTEQ